MAEGTKGFGGPQKAYVVIQITTLGHRGPVVKSLVYDAKQINQIKGSVIQT